MGIEALLRGWVSRAQPQAENDNDPGVLRLARYGEAYVVPLVRKQHALADEGSYFVANNGGAGVATAAAPTAFSDTAPLFTIFNNDSPTNMDNKRIHLDFLRVIETAAGTGATGLAVMIKLDNRNNYSSAGTQIFAKNPNMDEAASNSVADVRFLPTAVAVSSAARTVVGLTPLFYGMTAPVPIDTSAAINFGGVELTQSGPMGLTQTLSSTGLPPIVIGPGQCATIAFVLRGQSAASSWAPELGWWER